MDVDMNGVGAEGNSSCRWMWAPDQLDRYRMRLYLIGYPGESAQVLAIAVMASPAGSEQVIEETKPIIESIEFHTG